MKSVNMFHDILRSIFPVQKMSSSERERILYLKVIQIKQIFFGVNLHLQGESTFKSNIMLNAEGYHDHPSLILNDFPIQKFQKVHVSVFEQLN